jgi:hypothetical protein
LEDYLTKWCERQGQVEIGVIQREGRSFAAIGASIVGRLVTGDIYLKDRKGSESRLCWRR